MLPLNIKNILVRSPNWIGDQILSYPFFHYLRREFPNSRIAAACMPWVESVQFRNLVDEVYVLPKPINSTFSVRLKAIHKGSAMLRTQGEWDLGISLPNSFSAAWMLYLTQAKARWGFGTEGRSPLLTRSVPWDEKTVLHRAEAYLRLLPNANSYIKTEVREFWGALPENDLDFKKPGVVPAFDLNGAWSSSEMIPPPNQPYWVLAPGSNAESRRWPVENFTALARLIAQETGWTGVIVGGAFETQAAQIIARDPELRMQDYTARGTVASYAKIFRNARFTVCNDSGLAHMAAICGSPVHVVWGAGDLRRTQPFGPERVQISVNPADCWPCEKNHCSQELEGKLRCLKGIYADTVWRQIKAGLRPFGEKDFPSLGGNS